MSHMSLFPLPYFNCIVMFSSCMLNKNLMLKKKVRKVDVLFYETCIYQSIPRYPSKTRSCNSSDLTKILCIMHTIFIHKSQGGLGVLNFLKYFTAAQIAPLVSIYASQQAPFRINLKTFCCSLVSPHSLPWLPHKAIPTSMSLLMHHTFNT